MCFATCRDGWVEGGCEVIGGNATHTTCSCGHLSTFAVLLPSSSFLVSELNGYVTST